MMMISYVEKNCEETGEIRTGELSGELDGRREKTKQKTESYLLKFSENFQIANLICIIGNFNLI